MQIKHMRLRLVTDIQGFCRARYAPVIRKPHYKNDVIFQYAS